MPSSEENGPADTETSDSCQQIDGATEGRVFERVSSERRDGKVHPERRLRGNTLSRRRDGKAYPRRSRISGAPGSAFGAAAQESAHANDVTEK